MARGRFRLDLYYRLNGISLLIPPLRERTEEIEPLARTFVEQACRRSNRRELPSLTAEALQRLRSYSWPGNIRELRNTIERAVLLCGRGPIGVEHLSTEKMAATLPPLAPLTASPPAPATAFDGSETTHPFERSPPPAGDAAGLRDQLDALERQRILEALERCAGNQTRAAKLLGISRGTLVARLDAYGIARPRK